MATDFEKLKTFKGKIASKWTTPDNYRRWVGGANKLLKLYYRMTNSGLLWPDLVSQLQVAVGAWETIGLGKYQGKVNPRYFTEFAEIKKFNVTQFIAFQKNIKELLGDDKVDTFVEEKREREDGQRCHFCNVRLVFPAYIMHRFQTEIIHKSDPIGIMCLHAYKGKLEKLMEKDDLKRLINQAQRMIEAEKKELVNA